MEIKIKKSPFRLFFAGSGDDQQILIKNGGLPSLTDDEKKGEWVYLRHLSSLPEGQGRFLCLGLSAFWNLFRPSYPFYAPPYPDPQIKAYGSGHFHERKKLVIFGGSFDPWHEGHAECLRLCPEQENIIVIPDRNPFKTAETEQEKSTCPWSILQTLRMEINKINPAIPLYPGFIALKGKNPSSRWLPHLHLPFSLLMGDDSFASLPRWIEPARFLLQVQKFYIVPRSSKKEEVQTAEEWVKAINPIVPIIHLKEHAFQNISSTAIRQKGQA